MDDATENAAPGLIPFPEDFHRLLAIVAHPDDLEYGAASAVARWTTEGKSVGYVIATSGEAGIDSVSPDQAGPMREAEQRASAGVVGVGFVEFLGYRDGIVEHSPHLRRDIAREIRRFKPDLILIATHALTFGGNMLNQADHRAVGLAALDATKDAGNRWIFPELIDEGHEPWQGATDVFVMGSDTPTHGVDVTDYVEAGIASLQAHQTYIDGLGRDFNPTEFIRGFTGMQGEAFGTDNAVVLGHISLAGM